MSDFMGIIIRQAETKDIPAIRDILENDLGYNVPLSELTDRINTMLNRGNYNIFVACDSEKVVGFAGAVSFLAFEVKKECIKVIALAVSENYRRNGIGTQLLKEVEEFAKDNNMGIILLNSGLPRENAHKFYESQGYKKKSYGFTKAL